MPKVSILIITYNQAKYIEKSIESALNQSFKDFEIIVMDDASTDNTEEIIKSLAQKDNRIKYFRQENNTGIVKNRNDGLNKVQGEYVAILDSDDLWNDKNKLEKQVNFLDQNKDYAVVGTQTKTIDENDNLTGAIIHKIDDLKIRNSLLLSNQFVNSSVLMRKDKIKEVGGYTEGLIIGEDYDLFLKLGMVGKLKNLNSFDTYYRVHKKGITKQKKLVGAKNHLEIISKYKGKYPNYLSATLKSYLRILKAKM